MHEKMDKVISIKKQVILEQDQMLETRMRLIAQYMDKERAWEERESVAMRKAQHQHAVILHTLEENAALRRERQEYKDEIGRLNKLIKTNLEAYDAHRW